MKEKKKKPTGYAVVDSRDCTESFSVQTEKGKQVEVLYRKVPNRHGRYDVDAIIRSVKKE